MQRSLCSTRTSFGLAAIGTLHKLARHQHKKARLVDSAVHELEWNVHLSMATGATPGMKISLTRQFGTLKKHAAGHPVSCRRMSIWLEIMLSICQGS